MKQRLQNIFILLIILLLFNEKEAFGQFQKPFITYYSPKDYDAYFQNWQVIQDKRGIIYVANNFGVLLYNGSSWKRINNEYESIARSMEFFDHHLWVGGYNEIGYLAYDSLGNSYYHLITDTLSDVGNIWQMVAYNNLLYAVTDNYLIAFNSDTIIKFPQYKTYQTIAKINGRLFFSNDQGMLSVNGETVEELPNAKFFSDKKIYAINRLSDSLLLIAARDTNLLVYNYFTGQIRSYGSPELNKTLIESVIYGCLQLKDGNWCFYTRKKGVVIADKQGNLTGVVNKQTGLPSSTCWYVFEDKQSNLWLCLDKGIAKIEYSSPFSWYNENSGIDGTVMDVKEFNHRLYVATSVGLFQSNNFKQDKNTLRFTPVRQVVSQVWDLEIIGNRLFIATSDGLYRIAADKSGIQHILKSKVIFSLKASNHFANILYLGLENGLLVADLSEQPAALHEVKDINAQIRSIEEDNEQMLWLGTYGKRTILCRRDNSLIPWKFEQIKVFSEAQNMPGYEVDVFKIDEKIIFSTDYGLMTYEQIAGDSIRFFPYCRFGKEFCDSSQVVYRLATDYSNHVWLYSKSVIKDNENHLGFLEKVKDRYIGNYQAFNRIPEGDVFCFYPQNRQNVWFGGTEGLFLYNLEKPPLNINSIFYTLISKITVNDDSVLFSGNFVDKNRHLSAVQLPSAVPVLPYAYNNFTFEFSATNFIAESRTKYRYKLEGFDQKWSVWTTEHKKQYTNLPEGNYTFIVKSKDIFGNEAIQAKYSFVILPPWYRTVWAYILYVFGILLIVYIIIRISVYRLKQANKKLEKIVEERTQEVVKKNKQLNLALKDIQDSISYAKRMQESMLPPIRELKEHFADAFVFYVPRDIVSGDFYWFYHKNGETILAVADCTGHGVPGAFVSMLGYNMLNQIVFEKKETNPANILVLLNKSIQKVFHHKAADEYSVNDGMDIAILKLCGEKIYFAGANRPLLYIDKEQNLQQIAPDKKGIGGRTDYQATFSLHTIDKNTVDMCYLFSDGYPDQFGGPKGKKFLIKRFKEMVLKINNLSGEAQNMVIKATFDDWKKNTAQVDDVLVVGIRL